MRPSASSIRARTWFYYLAIGGCVALILLSLVAYVAIVKVFNLSVSAWSIILCPGVFPVGYFVLLIHGYVSDYRRDLAKGIVEERVQFGLGRLFLLVT